MPMHLSTLCALCSLTFLLACDTSAGRIDQACSSNSDCASNELCATGLCEGGIGSCIERPSTCEDVENPVCGCDGRTYQAECFASREGVRLATNQACICEDNGGCVDDQFCALDDSCGNPGTCLPRPESCDPSDTQEVCGCDGVTYPNECNAFQSASRVSALDACDCATNDDCGQSQFCNAITCDGPGRCEERPAGCPPEGPTVTGCDGVRYDSACVSAALGVRVRPDS